MAEKRVSKNTGVSIISETSGFNSLRWCNAMMPLSLNIVHCRSLCRSLLQASLSSASRNLWRPSSTTFVCPQHLKMSSAHVCKTSSNKGSGGAWMEQANSQSSRMAVVANGDFWVTLRRNVLPRPPPWLLGKQRSRRRSPCPRLGGRRESAGVGRCSGSIPHQ